jgi:hypothetical protein
MMILLFLLLTLHPGGSWSHLEQEAPKLVMSSIDQDLGMVRKSEGGSYTFRFQNVGTGDLRIEGVAPS